MLKSFSQCDNIAIKFTQRFQNQNDRWAKQQYLNIVSLYNMLLNVENFALVLRCYNSKLLKGCFDSLINPKIKEIMKDITSTLLLDEGPQNLNKMKDKIYYMVKNESNVALDLARLVHT